jgi:uncharacterized protein YutE (UPF0331/DUF86 family)
MATKRVLLAPARAPSETRESFAILVRENLFERDLGTRLAKTVGFRNLAVHPYHELDMNIVETVIRDRLDDLLGFADVAKADAERHPLLNASISAP